MESRALQGVSFRTFAAGRFCIFGMLCICLWRMTRGGLVQVSRQPEGVSGMGFPAGHVH